MTFKMLFLNIKKNNIKYYNILDKNMMTDLKIVYLYRTNNILVLTIDGMLDNEYGYVKFFSNSLKVGDTLPPFDLTITKLIKLENDWYF